MTEKPRAADPGSTGSAPGGARDDRAEGQGAERIVIRDKRRIDPTGGKVKSGKGEPAAEKAAAESTDTEVPGPPAPSEQPVDTPAPAAPASPAAQAQDGAEADEVKAAGDKAAGEKEQKGTTAAGGLGAELESLRAELEERTRDVQRVSAEYANYRKRVDRDRGLAAEQTTGLVISALLPVLDDLDRARDHGDLVGPFASVAEQLIGALGKFGLTAFGEKGDPFDPTRHEAVAHTTSAEVTEPTCVDVMRRGYQLGDRLLRPALVAVADPE